MGRVLEISIIDVSGLEDIICELGVGVLVVDMNKGCFGFSKEG